MRTGQETIVIKGRKERVMRRSKDKIWTLTLEGEGVLERQYNVVDGKPEFSFGFRVGAGYGPDSPGGGRCGCLRPVTIESYGEGLRLLKEVGIRVA